LSTHLTWCNRAGVMVGTDSRDRDHRPPPGSLSSPNSTRLGAGGDICEGDGRIQEGRGSWVAEIWVRESMAGTTSHIYDSSWWWGPRQDHGLRELGSKAMAMTMGETAERPRLQQAQIIGSQRGQG
jgi:hypothetical protein